MRWHEISSGIRVGPVSEEEAEILDMAEKGKASKNDMDERTQEVARQMVSRGILNQTAKDGIVIYKPNSSKDIWRDKD